MAGLPVGGSAPIVVQSMTNTDTADVTATVRQVRELAEAGSELVRITVNTDAAAAAVAPIRDALAAQGCTVPLIGDFHFNGHKLLKDNPACAEALAKYRINPGNVGRGAKRDLQFAELIEFACRYRKPVRIGVNWGSLDQDLLARLMDANSALPEPASAQQVMREALVRSAIDSAARAIELGLGSDRIILSAKVSAVQDLIAVYRELAGRTRHPLHLGLTEAGMGSKGIVASTAALAVLLQEGSIGEHDPHLPDAGAERRAHPRGRGRTGTAADHGIAQLYAASDGMSGLRAHHQHLFPNAGAVHSGASAAPHARVAAYPRGCRRSLGRGDGLRGERAG